MNESSTRTVEIAGRRIGYGQLCFIIAEAGVNHNGELALAKRLIDVAASSKADAIKFQSFVAGQLASAAAPKAKYQLDNTGGDESQLEMLQRLELSRTAHLELQKYANSNGLMFLSTPFDEASADLLDEMNVPAFKIGSGEITNLPLLEHVARKRKPIILSTGMSNLEEVAQAVNTLRGAHCDELILLQCVSNYPAAPEDVNLRAMQTMAEKFKVPVGYSDHTEGIDVALAAVALGACVIEKHFTIDKNLPGPDHKASLEPAELSAMVTSIRRVEAALGNGEKVHAVSETDTMTVARRSLTAARDMAAGTRLTRDMIGIQRPGTGVSPAMLGAFVGRKIRTAVRAGDLLNFDMLDSGE